jgi:hypothetical protein
VIGVYEALVLATRDGTRVTSRAADPGVAVSDGDGYHLACYESRSFEDAS